MYTFSQRASSAQRGVPAKSPPSVSRSPLASHLSGDVGVDAGWRTLLTTVLLKASVGYDSTIR